jgi:hypothetical protein
VNHGFNLVLNEGTDQLVAFSQIAYYKRSLWCDRKTMTARQIVIGNGAMTSRNEMLDDDTANVSGAAGYEHIHPTLLAFPGSRLFLAFRARDGHAIGTTAESAWIHHTTAKAFPILFEVDSTIRAARVDGATGIRLLLRNENQRIVDAGYAHGDTRKEERLIVGLKTEVIANQLLLTLADDTINRAEFCLQARSEFRIPWPR